MKNLIKLLGVLVVIVLILEIFTVFRDKRELKSNLIRMHVIANSDSSTDQDIKLQVKDEIVRWLDSEMLNLNSKEEAIAFLQKNLDSIKKIADAEIERLGDDSSVTVTLTERAFDLRAYDTFSLPSGIYDALCINIGAAEGQNWWCVAFPTLCIPATASEFVAVAADNGISESLSKDLLNTGEFRIRFYLLEQLGRLENFLWGN